MSLRSVIQEQIRGVKGALVTLENPTSTAEAMIVATRVLLGDSPKFWAEIAKSVKKMTAKPNTKSAVVAPAQRTSTPAPAPATTKSVTVPQSAQQFGSAPARMLTPANEERRDRLIGFLRKFVQAAGKYTIKANEVRERLEGMLDSGVHLEPEHFGVIFATAKKAAECGFYIIDQKTSSLFYKAPVELVEDYVFGQDREMVQVLAGLNESPVSRKTIARAFVLLDAIDALNSQHKLGEFEINRVEALLAAARRIEHKKLAEAIEKILSEEVPLKVVHERAKTRNPSLAEGLKKALAS